MIALAAAALAVTGCGGDEPATPAAPPTSADDGSGPTHIHGLGVDPADDALYIATHSGLFRAPDGAPRAERVGDSHQDTMGFTIAGPREFLGSGHPDARAELPPLLGLIRSVDGGRTWKPVSLLGEADFHVLRAAGKRVYGFDATQGRLMVSGDGGRSWQQRRPPAPLIDLAIDPGDPDSVVISSEAGLALSRDGGRRWRPLDRDLAGLLAWGEDGIVLVGGDGTVQRSADHGRSWSRAGQIGGQPAALSLDGDVLHAATHANEVKVSRDGGRTWTLRTTAG